MKQVRIDQVYFYERVLNFSYMFSTSKMIDNVTLVFDL